MLSNAVFWICLLIFYFSLLKYTYHYNCRSQISLQVAKLAKSAGGQILFFPTVYIQYIHTSTCNIYIFSVSFCYLIMYLSKYLTIHLFIYVFIYLFIYGPDNPPYFMAALR